MSDKGKERRLDAATKKSLYWSGIMAKAKFVRAALRGDKGEMARWSTIMAGVAALTVLWEGLA